MNPVEYIISLRDQASPVLSKIAESIGLVMDKFRQLSNESLAFVRSTATRIGTIYNNTVNAIASGVGKAINFVQNTAKRVGTIYDNTINSVKSGLSRVREQTSSGLDFLGIHIPSVADFGKKVYDATVQYNEFKATLSDTFQSKSIGEGAMNAITQFTVKSPSQINDVVNSFNDLAKNGINPTSDELHSLGDLAASKGKKFEDVGTALLSAQKGDFQMLNQFGIQASASGDKVRLSFNGVTKTVENNGQAIKTAAAEFGNMKGVAGSMEKIGHSFDDITNLKFLTEFIPLISKFFEILQTTMQPVIDSLWEFLRTMFGLNEGGEGVSIFTNILTGALFVVDLFSTGLSLLIDWLTPFAPIIFGVVAAIAAFNLVMALNPIEWVVIGIIALITIIGLVVKYTDGWGQSWNALCTIFTLIWEQITASFHYGVDSIVYGFTLISLQAQHVVQTIVGTFGNLGTAIGMALNGDLTGAMNTAFQRVETQASRQIETLRAERQRSTEAFENGRESRRRAIGNAMDQIHIDVDFEGMGKDLGKIKDSFKGVGQDTKAYDEYARNNKGKNNKNNSSEVNKSATGGITGGGTQTSHITINLAKMQDQIVINTINSGEGATKLRQLLEEELNRLLGSITLMQTA